MYIHYDPLDEKFKSIPGGIAEDAVINFFVGTDAEKIEMEFYGDNRPISLLFTKTEGGFVLKTSFKSGLYFYKLKACGGSKEQVFGSNEKLLPCENGDPWQLTVYPADYTTPEWIKGGIIYQIFPDRFCRIGDFTVPNGKVARYDWGGTPTFRSSDGEVKNNEFFGGDFKGIQSKADYICDLFVTAVYLNPICESYSSHRYDTGDYKTIDCVLGTENELKDMLSEYKKRSVSFIFDGVFNHVGADSRYFNKFGNYDSLGAYQSTNSPYFEWFKFRDYPNDYECWWDFKTLPSIRKDCDDFQNFISGDGGVLQHWLSLGFGGVRLDVADELTDEFIKKIREKIKRESADNLLIGEVWEDATNKIAYGIRRKYFTGGELDSVMNYPLKDGICSYVLSGDCGYLEQVVCEQLNNYPKPALDCLMNVLSTHDSVRAITLFGRKTPVYNKDEMADEKLTAAEYNRGKARLKCASVLQFFLYGVPSVYYGDEVGLQGDLDPYNRRCLDWNKTDEELLNHYKKLSAIRTENKHILSNGKTRIITANKGVFAFERTSESGKLIIVVNLENNVYKIKSETEFIDLYNGSIGNCAEINPMGFVVLRANR